VLSREEEQRIKMLQTKALLYRLQCTVVATNNRLTERRSANFSIFFF